MIYIIQSAQIIFMFGALFQMRVSENKKRICLACIVLLISIITTLFYPTDDVVWFQIIFMYIICAFLFKKTWGEYTIKFMFSLFFGSFFAAPFRLIFSIAERHKMNYMIEDFSGVIIEIMALVLMYFAYRIIKMKKIEDYIATIAISYFGIGLAISFCISFINAVMLRIQIGQRVVAQDFVELMTTLFTEAIYIGFIGLIYVNYCKEKYRRESDLKSEYLHMSKEHYDSLKESMIEVRKIKHDMKSHLNVLMNYIDQNDYEKARKYIKEINGHIEHDIHRNYDIGNDLVNALLNYMTSHCESNIEFIVKGHITNKVKISDYDLCTIFSNLLSNSIEACERLEHKNKIIEINIKTKESKTILNVTNPIESQIDANKIGKGTIKSNKKDHGFGISRIIETVEKNKGQVFFDTNNGKFQVTVVI